MSKLRQAELVSSGERELMLLGVKANGAVKGRLLVMTLEQKYRNSSNQNTEITYTFPLPFGAVLMEVEVELNGKLLQGAVSAKSTARDRYEVAISEGNSSIMLEKNHDGSFTLELGNLMSHEECRIMIRYAQVLQTEQGQVRFMLPTTIAPRYGNPITQGKLQPHQVSVTDLAAEYPFDITLTLMGEMAHTNVACPSHKTSYLRNKDDLIVKLSQRGYLDRDFVLIVSNLKNESDALACMDLYDNGQYAVMAFFSPEIPSVVSKNMTAKILVDCSASMAGDSIDAARRALQGIVAGLAKEDKFTLSRFGDTVEHRSRGMWSGTSQAKASAMRWIENVHADLGGTEMAQALVSTVGIADAGMSDILLITDGEIEGIDEVIEVAKESNHRIFIVAIGASPAEVHLRRLAAQTGGHCDFVAPGEDVEPAVLRMSARMHAARATDMRVEWPKSLKLKWEQKVQNYAFENDALNVCAFVDAPGAESELTQVKLWGRVEGQVEEVLMGKATIAPTESSTNILARLSAYQRYQELVEGRTYGASANLSAAQSLAVTYKLVTNETNFILVHERSEADKAQEMPEVHKVQQMLAAGWGGTGSVVSARDSAAVGPLACSISALSGHLPLFAAPSMSVHDSIVAPTVWKSKRTSAAAKVDALGTGGMDDYDIPAFLRKQTEDDPIEERIVRKSIDKSNAMFWKRRVPAKGRNVAGPNEETYVGLTPAGLAKWLTINDTSFWPSTYAELRDIGLDLSICEWLEFQVGLGHKDANVVQAFLEAILELGFNTTGVISRTVSAMQKTVSLTIKALGTDELADDIRKGLRGTLAQSWPLAVIRFPECVSV